MDLKPALSNYIFFDSCESITGNFDFQQFQKELFAYKSFLLLDF